MSVPRRLRADLVTAIRERNKVAVSMIRTLIAAIENAEAVEAESMAEVNIGLNHDRPRRDLSQADIASIVARERDELTDAVKRYRELGLTTELAELEERMAVVDRYIEPVP